MYIFITVSMQIRIKNCGTLSSGECAGPTVAALLGCMGWAGLGWADRERKWNGFFPQRGSWPGYRRHLSWPQRSSILEQGPSICNHIISMLGHGSRVTTLYIWTWFTWDIMSTSPVCNHIHCHLWAECWSPSYASFPPPWPSSTPSCHPPPGAAHLTFTLTLIWLWTLADDIKYILYLTYPCSHSLQCPSFYSFPQMTNLNNKIYQISTFNAICAWNLLCHLFILPTLHTAIEVGSPVFPRN